MATKRKKLENKLKTMKTRYPKETSIAEKIMKSHTKKNKSKDALNQIKFDHILKIVNKKFLTAVNDFVKKNPDSALASLQKVLPELGMRSLNDFMDAIEFSKFLTGRSNKGYINEILILKSKPMVGFLLELGETSMKDIFPPERINLSMKKKADIADLAHEIADKVVEIADIDSGIKTIINKNGKLFVRDEFIGIKTVIATKLHTYPNNWEFHDFAVLRYNPKTKRVLIIHSGEIKEPAAMKKVGEQLGKSEVRIDEATTTSFYIGEEKIHVNTEDVFIRQDNAIGVGRVTDDTDINNIMKDINLNSSIIKDINFFQKFTKPPKNNNQQLMYVFSVKIDEAFTPDRLVNEIRHIRMLIKK